MLASSDYSKVSQAAQDKVRARTDRYLLAIFNPSRGTRMELFSQISNPWARRYTQIWEPCFLQASFPNLRFASQHDIFRAFVFQCQYQIADDVPRLPNSPGYFPHGIRTVQSLSLNPNMALRLYSFGVSWRRPVTSVLCPCLHAECKEHQGPWRVHGCIGKSVSARSVVHGVGWNEATQTVSPTSC